MKVTIKGNISSNIKQQVYGIIANSLKEVKTNDLQTSVTSA